MSSATSGRAWRPRRISSARGPGAESTRRAVSRRPTCSSAAGLAFRGRCRVRRFVRDGRQAARTERPRLRDAQTRCRASCVRGRTTRSGMPALRADLRERLQGPSRLRAIASDHVGDLQLSYFEDLRWDGCALSPNEKEHVSRDFGSYASYRGFLDESMATFADNARSSARQNPLRLLSTLSAGYDSAMVTVLGQQVGCHEAVGFNQARSGEDDSGQPIAEALGIRFHALDSSAWRAEPSVVTSFLAGGAGNGVDVIFHGAGSLLQERCCLPASTATRCGTVGPHTSSPTSFVAMHQGLTSPSTGWRRFRQLPRPLLGCPPDQGRRQSQQLAELSPWDVGRPYSRPICRRIVEEAGVPREMFGVRKRAACVDLLSDLTSPGNASDFLTGASRGDYFQWLREQRTSDDRPHHTEVPWPGFFDYRSPPGRAVNAVLGRSAAQRLGPRSRAILGAATLEIAADRNLESGGSSAVSSFTGRPTAPSRSTRDLRCPRRSGEEGGVCAEFGVGGQTTYRHTADAIACLNRATAVMRGL